MNLREKLLKDLNLLFLNLTQRIESFFECDSQNIGHFPKNYDSKNWIFKYESKISIFFPIRKQLHLFLWIRRKELNPFFFQYDAKNWTLFFEYDAKKWTPFSFIWRKELNSFLWIWRKEMNTFFFHVTQRIETFDQEIWLKALSRVSKKRLNECDSL